MKSEACKVKRESLGHAITRFTLRRSLPHRRRLGRVDYEPTWRAMRDFTAARNERSADELWLLEHPPVYTLGVAGRNEHLPRGETASRS